MHGGNWPTFTRSKGAIRKRTHNCRWRDRRRSPSRAPSHRCTAETGQPLLGAKALSGSVRTIAGGAIGGVVRVAPHHTDARRKLANLYSEQRRYQEAYAQLQVARSEA